MLCAHVVLNVRHVGGGIIAEVAAVRPLPRVLIFVRFQVHGVGEVTQAVLAHVPPAGLRLSARLSRSFGLRLAKERFVVTGGGGRTCRTF